MSSDNNLMQFRYIDENGQEIIKVERKSRSDKVQILPESLLQNKSNKYYLGDFKTRVVVLFLLVMPGLTTWIVPRLIRHTNVIV